MLFTGGSASLSSTYSSIVDMEDRTGFEWNNPSFFDNIYVFFMIDTCSALQDISHSFT